MLETMRLRADAAIDLRAQQRIGAALLPAAVITLGLFFAMRSLVHVEGFDAPTQRVYEVTGFMVQDASEIIHEATRKPVRQSPIDPPPLAEPLRKTLTNVKGPTGEYAGAAPTDFRGPDFRDIMPRGIGSVVDRTMQPITPPVPTYPEQAVRRGLSGSCDIHLSITPKGDPYDIRAECSDSVFKRAAEKAVSKVKFAPKIRDGLPIAVTGVVYPIEFRMEPE